MENDCRSLRQSTNDGHDSVLFMATIGGRAPDLGREGPSMIAGH
jgi:hypothetical protein